MSNAAKIDADALGAGSSQPMSDDLPVITYETDGFIMATWRNVVIQVWTKQATLAIVDKLGALAEAFVATQPRGISSIHVVAKDIPLPDQAVRDRFVEVANGFAKQLACVGHVVEGYGLWAGALQSFITGVHWLLRRPFKFQICSSISAVAQWLPEPHWQRTGVSFETRELQRALEYVRMRAR